MLNILDIIHPTKIYTEQELASLLDSRFREDLLAYKEFVEQYKRKLRVIEEFLYFWKHGSFKKDRYKFQEIKLINLSLIKSAGKFVTDILKRREITQSFLYRILSRKAMEAGISDMAKRHSDAFSKQFYYLISRINEDLKVLIELLKQQNKYIKKDNEWQTLTELREHGQFFRLLRDEYVKIGEIKHNIVIILRNLKRIVENAENESIKQKLTRVRFAKVYAGTYDLRKFYYGLFIDRFPDPNERDPFAYINDRIKDGKFHLIIAKIDDEIVGGVIYSMFTYNELSQGIILWVCVAENLRELGIKYIGSRLVQKSISDMMIRASFNKITLNGVFAELNDPEKMTDKQIREDVMNPNKRIEFWRSAGFKRTFKGYVQLTSDPKGYVYYCSLFLVPTSKKWEKGLSRTDLYNFLLGNAIFICAMTTRFIQSYKPWQDMMKELNKQEFYPLE